jgi:hypothetical protein
MRHRSGVAFLFFGQLLIPSLESAFEGVFNQAISHNVAEQI